MSSMTQFTHSVYSILRMKCGGDNQPCPQMIMQHIPKDICESNVHVAYGYFGDTMKLIHMIMK